MLLSKKLNWFNSRFKRFWIQWFDSIHDSSDFWRSWFDSIHELSKKHLILIQFMIHLIQINSLPVWIYIYTYIWPGFGLTRARVAVSATFAMVGGGKMTPPLTRKLGKIKGGAIRRSTALSEPVRSHFGHFFAQVNIEVSRGHQRSNFRKMVVLSGMPAIISGTIIATPNPKKSKRELLKRYFAKVT